jgi:monoamine oxidase
MNTETLIIGGGLSGLYAAEFLLARGEAFLLLEARPFLGGRRTLRRDGHAFDLGPSWFWPTLNPRLAALVERLALPHHPQHTAGDALLDTPGQVLRRQPHHEVDPRLARRLTGGTQSLVEALAATLPTDKLLVAHRAASLTRHDDHLAVTAEAPAGARTFHAFRVILALPPRLVAEQLAFTPALPENVTASLHAIPTWMAGDAKFFALYDDPF